MSQSALAFTFTLTRRDWKRLRKLSKRLDCDMYALGWKGTPFFLGRLRHRYGLWITLGVCSLLLFCGSFFIWDFQIEGNETVSEQEILRALEKCGVRFGSYGYGVNSFELRNDLLLELPEPELLLVPELLVLLPEPELPELLLVQMLRQLLLLQLHMLHRLR